MSGSIYLFRHAEAGWGGQEFGDKARQLSDIGQQSAIKMGEWFKEQGHPLDLILCSPAVRALETKDGFLKAAGLSPKVDLIDPLYLAPPETIQVTLDDHTPFYENIMVIGHNPGMHQLAFDFAVNSLAATDLDLTTSYPPAALTGFTNKSGKAPLYIKNILFKFYCAPDKL